MNAIVGLCHFCEAHGPRPVFCTFTTDNEEHTTESSTSTVQCNGCTSLGPETVLASRDDDGTIFCSRESIPNPDVTSFLRQAAIRSITCEVSWSKEGGVVYFSDTQGHVLSYTFQLQDTRARGLKRWFSIVVLMKDKMLLLNISTILSEHMQKISKDLQKLASVVFDNEQKICSQRALRLRTGRNDFGQSRSLLQLTGDEDIFKQLHSHFTWLLKIGAHTYTEKLYSSQEMLSKLHPSSFKGSIFETGACTVPSDIMPLRGLQDLLNQSVFKVLMYCVLTGINVFISPSVTEATSIITGLSRLLPVVNKNPPNIRLLNDKSLNSCVLEEGNEGFCYKWSGSLPVKCPTIMNRIESAMSNGKFNDAVLRQQVISLKLEWLGIARSVKAAVQSSGAKSPAVLKLKQTFGVAQHDEQLLRFWMNAFCE